MITWNVDVFRLYPDQYTSPLEAVSIKIEKYLNSVEQHYNVYTPTLTVTAEAVILMFGSKPKQVPDND